MAQGSLLAATILTFTHTVGEFGVVLMLGGNIPGVTRTLSIALFDQVQDADYAAANRTALVLVGVAIATLVAVYAGLNRSARSRDHVL
jgi:molybdate transport system permease protein